MTSATGFPWAAGATLPPRTVDIPLHATPLRATGPHRTAVSVPVSSCRVCSSSRPAVAASCGAASAVVSEASSPPAVEEDGELSEEEAAAREKVGARVRVSVPLKVYHVPKVPEVDLTGMEGVIKEYVVIWKGKRISANLPFKVQFQADLPGRGPAKFFAHLREDEFEIIG